jgi:CheY-like chemotaxis protein
MTQCHPAHQGVLLVEDDEATRVAVTTILEDEGFRVASAEDGQAALNYLKSAPELPGVILLDLMMPGMDGPAFRKQQSADARIREIPVVIVSAAGDLARRASELGARDFLLKPIDLDSLIETVRRFC